MTWHVSPRPGFGVQHLPWAMGRGAGVAVVYRKTILHTGKPVQHLAGLQCLLLTVEERDRLGVRPLCCSTGSLLELANLVSDVMVRSPRLVLLRGFNIHAEAI